MPRKNRDDARMKSLAELDAEVEQKLAAEAEQKKRTTMTPEEILELLELKGWNQAMLANELAVGHVTVWRWIEGKNKKPPPLATQMVMRQWLEQARKTPMKPQKQTA